MVNRRKSEFNGREVVFNGKEVGFIEIKKWNTEEKYG